MAISEQLQQRIDNLTQGMGATSNKEMEMLKDSTEQQSMIAMDMVSPTKGAISNREMELFRNASPSMGTMGGSDETQQH